MQSIKFLTKQTISSFYSVKYPQINSLYNTKIKDIYRQKKINRFDQDLWNNWIANLKIDLTVKNIENELLLEESIFEVDIKLVFEKLNLLIRDYEKERALCSALHEISSNSLKNYLYLYPHIENYHSNLNIDSDTGFLNIGFSGKQSELLNALVTDTGEIHYSLVGRSKRIFKITGVTKIRDIEDFKQFKRVIRML